MQKNQNKYNSFLNPTIVFTMRINVGHIYSQAMWKFKLKMSRVHINCFLQQWMWVILLFCATFDLQQTSNILVGSFHGELGEDLGSSTHVNISLLETSVAHVKFFHTNFLPTLIRLFNVLRNKWGFLLLMQTRHLWMNLGV